MLRKEADYDLIAILLELIGQSYSSGNALELMEN